MTSTQPTSEQGTTIKLIVAYSRNRTIGRDNTLPWRLPGDLKHFKQQTLGHPIIMGRKTWESLGRPLPGRLNVVVTRTLKEIQGAKVAASLEQAISLTHGHDCAYIIGGANLYEQALVYATEIIATEIQAEIDGDAHFPELDRNIWAETQRRPQPPENGLRYDFVTYVKR
ncbi:dihydrofolate reductase [Orrella marina]|uniref:Dihydrofolate reductase n=1 Tax=Orrella marina TaxID=2163011 RepID=A0A2R4XKR4_9BURK|nr:dihydrofolate reductase [Orrella marina]AWB34354.1 dihydrofolate reductase [Orrella marina]